MLRNTLRDPVFCGDFNFDLLKEAFNNKVSNFYDTMQFLGLIPLIAVPTRTTNESQTLLYTILISKPYDHTSGVLTFDVFNNFPVFSILEGTSNSVSRKETIQYHVLNDETLKQLHDNLSARDFQNMMEGENYDWAISELDSDF